jgi:hypothetical protein
MADTNEVSLPAGLLSTGDPVIGNPFPASDPRHRVWYDASLSAEEAVRRLNSEFMKTRVSDVDSLVAWMIGLVVQKFDVWARRSIQVVWSDDEIRSYEQWLLRHANALLDECREAGHFSPDTLLECRSRLIERVRWWKVEARTYLAKKRVRPGRATNANAQRKFPNPKRRNESYNSPADFVRRRQIVLQNVHLTAKQLCGIFDANIISVPESWHEVTWVNAYKNRRVRALIQTMISRDKSGK